MHRLCKTSLFCAAIVVAATRQTVAEVIDLNADKHSGRVTASVWDFAKSRGEEDENRSSQTGSERASIKNRGVTTTKRRYGSAEIERLIADVSRSYAGHSALRGNDVTATEWQVLFRAMIAVESDFKQSARSHVGAIGLGQLMPGTAKSLGVNPYDARDNLTGAARYLLAQLEKFGSVELALAAYNAGPNAVSRYGAIPPYRETQEHVRRVLSIVHSNLNSSEKL